MDHHIIFINITRVVSLLYLLTLCGVFIISPEHVSIMRNAIAYFVCLFLVYRFNPFMRSQTFTELDRSITFYASVLLLSSTAIASYAEEKISQTIRTRLQPS